MKLLLDTQAFIWFDGKRAKLSRAAHRRVADRANELYLSVASIWEMSIKIGLGKLRLGTSLRSVIDDQVAAAGLRLLDVNRWHAEAVQHLPSHHGDPFDRLLIAQAAREGLAVVSSDERFDAYDVKRIW